ncbi:MAG: HD domain-containing protein [Candidatus Altiarchaeales archaeon]|nr:HD domain-containing protein [Candidatus Altiarchaeales archaeon]
MDKKKKATKTLLWRDSFDGGTGGTIHRSFWRVHDGHWGRTLQLGVLMSIVEKARLTAISEHEGQTYGDKPYSYHLEQVAEIAKQWGPHAEAAAWLHDVLEDTEMVEEELQRDFPPPIPTIINLLTDADIPNRKLRKKITYEKLSVLCAEGPEGLALLVKLADRLANVRQCVESENWGLLSIYRKEQKAFREAVYRTNQPENLWSELEKLLKRGRKRR